MSDSSVAADVLSSGQRSGQIINAKKLWKAAAVLARDLPDPWAGLGFEDLQEETVTRHMYNPRNGRWKTDTVIVKIQSESFAHGAMRECYRMKKLSKFSQHPNWKNASNYVAKRYMKAVERETYFDDVKLQMDSKLWGEEYSKLRVPKKVDFCQTYIIEFKGRGGSPLYGVEHFIDGGYIKYNSNSGFVSDVNRLTPQAFSHFSFEKSDHHLIVVDIQGVGDIYTDPQMHTVDMKEYGEANLGTRGMALFFSSHVCSPLCEILGLTQFDLAEDDLDRLRSRRWNFSSSTTKISDLDMPSADLVNSNIKDSPFPTNSTVRDVHQRLGTDIGRMGLMAPLDLSVEHSSSLLESPLPLDSPLDSPLDIGGLHIRVSPVVGDRGTGVGEGGGEVFEEEGENVDSLRGTSEKSSRPNAGIRVNATEGVDGNNRIGNSVHALGMIHLDLAQYHGMGRFSEDQAPNLKSAMFHLAKAADCGVVDALYTLAHVYLQQSHDSFTGLRVEATPEHECEGMEYLVKAAEKGLRAAMLEVARALDTGLGLGAAADNSSSTTPQRSQNWCEAVKWYRRAVSASSEGTLNYDPSPLNDPDYSILARMAAMHLKGGFCLEKDPQMAGELYTEAADSAMLAMKGKLSAKYYVLAEEAWSETAAE